MTTAITDISTLIPGLHASTPQPLPFDETLVARAFLLEREAGNLLIYSNGELARDAEAFRSLGGVQRQYLNHWHESLFGGLDGSGLEAPLFVHREDSPQTAKRLHVRGAFSKRHFLDDDFEVIPTPGHTPGATAYLWDTGEHRLLFTGDTLYLRGSEWVAAVLDSSDRERYVESLELLRGLDFDVLVPWAATAGRAPYTMLDRGEARECIDAVLERVREGASG
jgi:glyoxylase-like metal-dependent hydrolase (beta-lactamase superfamily II)